MAKIENKNRWDLELPGGNIVPGFGSLETTNEVIRMIDNKRVLDILEKTKEVIITLDADPELREARVLAIEPASQDDPTPMPVESPDQPADSVVSEPVPPPAPVEDQSVLVLQPTT